MRTYSRKRPEYKEIEGVEDLCRLCLGNTEDHQLIFPDNSDDVCSFLALRIMICVGLEVTKEDNLPNLVCMDCYKEIERCYTFRKKCEMTYQKLKSHLQAVKEKKGFQNDEKQRQDNQNEIDNKVDCDRSNLVYTVNMDGTIQLSDGDNSLTNGDPLVTLIKLDSEALYSEGSNCDEIFFSREETLPMIYKHVEKENNEDYKETNVEVHKAQDNNTNDVELSSFLSSMLLELGIVTQQNGEMNIVDPNIRTIELETGDGTQITLKLMEEDDQEEPQSTSKQSVEIKDILVQNNNSANVKEEKKKGQPSLLKGGAWCDMCGKAFASRSVVSRHVRDVHARTRPHSCLTCGKRFAQREVLLRHQLVHEENRPFQCPQCPKSFTQRSSLDMHTRLHAPPEARGLSIHQCSRCPKVFLYSSGLSRHMVQHTGKVFQCNSCDRKFNDRSSLLRHVKVMKHTMPTSTPSCIETNGI